MKGRYKIQEDKEWGCGRNNSGALPRGSAAHLADTHSHVPGLNLQAVSGADAAAKLCSDVGRKVYLGVRVKMPVKELLKNIRMAQGWNPQDLQNQHSKTLQGAKKRVKTRMGTSKRKRSTSSLEELAIIVEVLEEDLRTGTSHTSPFQTLSSPSSEVSPTLDPNGYNTDESDEVIPRPKAHMAFSPGIAEQHQVPPPPGANSTTFQPSGTGDDCFAVNTPKWTLSSSQFFWAQLQKEEVHLRDIPDSLLLATDGHGRTALHSVVCDGKRALAYAMAKRMAALNSLDLKDLDGMTALLLAAQHNQHLLMDDLILLGASINERNHSGKSCLHLSAEQGFIRVLEVVKRAMMKGVYIDIEATDNSGMSVLQCASVALKSTLQELELSRSFNNTRLHTLRKEKLLETLECLLQMASYSHAMGSAK
ncbi:NF-kappa-B inhibitor zeta [Dunckerocampus dactyliophorus]|uniref:NF-kappa-B inhibitor zeta n=1 Tax=Dunckerocampus dactyliophorus TaxID=161453 RepID=UPI0024064EE6|nr:NF-kappa-B inhibitor zeta [Dunckerocampus dactyliophorus]